MTASITLRVTCLFYHNSHGLSSENIKNDDIALKKSSLRYGQAAENVL